MGGSVGRQKLSYWVGPEVQPACCLWWHSDFTETCKKPAASSQISIMLPNIRASRCSWPSSSLVPEAHGGVITASLPISGTAYLHPSHGSHQANENSSPCPLFPEHPRVRWNLAERDRGNMLSKSGVISQLALRGAGSSELGTPWLSAGERGPLSPCHPRCSERTRGRGGGSASHAMSEHGGCSLPAVTPSRDSDSEQLPSASAQGQTAQVGFHLPRAGAAPHGRKPLMIARCRAEKGGWLRCVCCLLMKLLGRIAAAVPKDPECSWPFVLLAAVSGSFSSVMAHGKQQPLKYLFGVQTNNE